MNDRLPLTRKISAILPLLLVVGGCVYYAAYASRSIPNGKLRKIPSPFTHATPGNLIRLEHLSTLKLPGSVLNMNAHDSVLYASMTSAGFESLDISDPAAPALRSHIRFGGEEDGLGRREYAINVFRVGEKLVVLDRIWGIRVYDAADPFKPVYEWSRRFPGSPGEQPVDLEQVGDRIFLACGGGGLQEVPSNLAQDFAARSLLPVIDYTRDVLFVPPRWLVVTDGRETGFHLLELGEGGKPRLTGNLTRWPLFMEQAVLVRNRLYMSVRGYNVVLGYNLDNPATPYLSTAFKRDRSLIKSITTWKDRYVLVGNYFGFIEFIDLIEPDNPTLVGMVTVPGQINTMFVRDDILYAGLWGRRRVAVYRMIEDPSLLRAGGNHAA